MGHDSCYVWYANPIIEVACQADRCTDTGDTFTGLEMEFATLYNEGIEGWVNNGTGVWQVSIFKQQPLSSHNLRVCVLRYGRTRYRAMRTLPTSP